METPGWMAHILANDVTAVWFMYPFELLCISSHEKVIRLTVWYKYHIKLDQNSSNSVKYHGNLVEEKMCDKCILMVT